MIERRDALFTLIQDRDLHDNGFTCAHFIGNNHIDLTLPLNRHDHRTIHLGARQCWLWGIRFQRFYMDIAAAEPASAGDFQI